MNDESGWSVATGEDQGNPLIFRIRNAPPSFVVQSEFSTLLAIAWSFEPITETGMSAPDDTKRMTELEDLLETGLEGSKEAFLTVVVTGNGVREWQWYARSSDRVMELVNATLGHLEPFPIQISFQDDPEWQAYDGFLNL